MKERRHIPSTAGLICLSSVACLLRRNSASTCSSAKNIASSGQGSRSCPSPLSRPLALLSWAPCDDVGFPGACRHDGSGSNIRGERNKVKKIVFCMVGVSGDTGEERGRHRQKADREMDR